MSAEENNTFTLMGMEHVRFEMEYEMERVLKTLKHAYGDHLKCISGAFEEVMWSSRMAFEAIMGRDAKRRDEDDRLDPNLKFIFEDMST